MTIPPPTPKPLSFLGYQMRRATPYLSIPFLGALAAWPFYNDGNLQGKDILALGYGTVLSIGIVFLNRRQNEIQRATANLELREKICVIHASSLRAAAEDELIWSLYVGQDCRAALHLYTYARDTEKADLLGSIADAYKVLGREAVIKRLREELDDPQLDCVKEAANALAGEIVSIVGDGDSGVALGAIKSFLQRVNDPGFGAVEPTRATVDSSNGGRLKRRLQKRKSDSAEAMMIKDSRQ